MDIRDTARVVARFIKRGTLTDPTTVTMRVTPPSGQADAYVVTYPTANVLAKLSTGVFEGLVPVPYAGRWRVEVIGTGVAAGGGMTTFYVFS